MKIGERIRRMRIERQLSPEDIPLPPDAPECCIACIENGDKFPGIETLKKIAQTFGVEPYRLFYNGPLPPPLPNLPGRLTADDIAGADAQARAFLHDTENASQKGTSTL